MEILLLNQIIKHWIKLILIVLIFSGVSLQSYQHYSRSYIDILEKHPFWSRPSIVSCCTGKTNYSYILVSRVDQIFNLYGILICYFQANFMLSQTRCSIHKQDLASNYPLNIALVQIFQTIRLYQPRRGGEGGG